MAFQFLCPQGHLLQGEESQAGQRCKCPYCQAEFLVPPCRVPPPEAFPGIDTGGGKGDASAQALPQFGPTAAEQQSLLHIPCPNGHVLETPREMLGEVALCPYCRAPFRLRFEDSRQRQREKAEQRARREQKLATAWMNWAITAAVVVVLGIIVLVAIAASQ